MARHRLNALPLLLALLLSATAFALSACGYSSESKDVAEGEPVKLGDLKYEVIFSRYLNPHDNEDAAYLVGRPEAPPGYSYFGVFLEVQNESDEPKHLPSIMAITDTEHNVFHPVGTESLYALQLGGEVEPEEQVPVLDSTPQQGPIEGSMVLFEMTDEVSENRPLTLHIPGPEPEESASITLDL